MTVVWSNDIVYNLIELFRDKPLLWDASLEDYKDRNKKHDAWLAIAQSLNMDKAAVERKVKSLLTQFRRELNKPKSEDGTEASKWFAFKKMLFLKGKNTPRDTVFAGSEEENMSNDQIEDLETSNKTVQLTNHKRAKPTKTSTNDRTEETYNILKSLYEKRDRDEFSIYGEYVASKLRKISNYYVRSTAQHHINNILYTAEIGEYDWMDEKRSNGFRTGNGRQTTTMQAESSGTSATGIGYSSMENGCQFTATNTVQIRSSGTAIDKSSANTVPADLDSDSGVSFDSQSLDNMLQDIRKKEVVD